MNMVKLIAIGTGVAIAVAGVAGIAAAGVAGTPAAHGGYIPATVYDPSGPILPGSTAPLGSLN